MHCDNPSCDENYEINPDSDNDISEEAAGSQIPWKSSPSAATILNSQQKMPSDVAYKQLYQLRITQIRQGVDLSALSRVQWGLSTLKFSHHIVLKKSPWGDAGIPFIFRVAVCKTCSPAQDNSSTFLGVYGDQESALLVNDVHEILSGRCDKLSVLRKEDAMFFHHLTARTLDESNGSLLPATPVLSVLEKLRINSANASLLAAAALEEKKRKRSSTIDLLIESSLSLSMTSRDNSSSNGEGEEGEDEDQDEDDIEGEEGDDNGDSCRYSTSSTYRNHSPFSSFPSTTQPIATSKTDAPVTRSRSSNADSMKSHSSADALSALTRHSPSSRDSDKSKGVQCHVLSELLSRTRNSRPRASTFSVSSATSQSSQSLLDNEAARTPMGLVTWLASLEDDDFVAAKLLTEMGSKEKRDVSGMDAFKSVTQDIPKYRGTCSSVAVIAKDSTARYRERDASEPPAQRRRRANSVIEVSHDTLTQKRATLLVVSGICVAYLAEQLNFSSY